VQSLMSNLTHNVSFWRRVHPGNWLHCTGRQSDAQHQNKTGKNTHTK